jgi:hypothetical protein
MSQKPAGVYYLKIHKIKKMKNKFFPYILISLAFFILYQWGSFQKIPFGDCVGQVADTEKGIFVLKSYSNTHFLYINSLILLRKIFPFFDSITLCRYFVIGSAIVALNILYYTILLLIKQRFSALAGTFCMGLGFSFWRNTEIVEVYTFNLIFIALYVLFVVKAFIIHSKYAAYAGFVLGISLWSHIQNILLIPSYGFLLWILYPKNYRKILTLTGIVAIFFLSLYIQPLISNTPIIKVLSSDQSPWVEDTFKKTLMDYLKDFFKSIAYLIYNFWYFIFPAILGIKYLYSKNPDLFWFLLVFSAPVYGFATVYAVSDNYVFFLGFYVVFAILIGTGVFYLSNYRKLNKFWVIFGIALIPFLYSASKYAVSCTQKGQTFAEKKAYKGGLNYYFIPWMNQNVGIIEFTMEGRKSSDLVYWMTESAEEFVELRKKKNPNENVNEL